jgi:hypothetical protein
MEATPPRYRGAVGAGAAVSGRGQGGPGPASGRGRCGLGAGLGRPGGCSRVHSQGTAVTAKGFRVTGGVCSGCWSARPLFRDLAVRTPKASAGV